jgi:hypothetical protein
MLGEAAFMECSSLTSICIPSSIERIPKHCFKTCINLSTVTFERGCVISIVDEAAFADCLSLQSIVIPSSFEVVSPSWFEHCPTLINVVLIPVGGAPGQPAPDRHTDATLNRGNPRQVPQMSIRPLALPRLVKPAVPDRVKL